MGPNIDINNIRQALMSRLGGGSPGPVLGQMSQPAGAMPNGGLPVPGMPAPAMPSPAMPAPGNMGPRPGGASPAQSMAKAATQAQSPLMEPDTREIAKVLIQKLMKHL